MATKENKPLYSLFEKAPSPLGVYRLLAPKCALRVSPICLGAMNFGEKWTGFMGAITKEEVFNILDTFYKNGGNFIDTANNYQEGESEEWIGEWFTARKIRDEIVLATKFSSPFKREDGHINVNFVGNSRKSLFTSVEASLKKLQTHYIDILYIHWWDFSASVEEVMQGLHQLVATGKVLYLGISDAPAWVVAKANQYARDHALTPFVVYQGLWSIGNRDVEREIIPVLKDEGMGFAPWGVLGQGMFKTDEEIKKLEEAKKETGEQQSRAERPGRGYEQTRGVTRALEKIAKQKGTSISNVASSYIFAKYPWVFPILGGRRVNQLEDNIKGLEVKVTEEEIKELEEASPLVKGFPYDFIGSHPSQNFLVNTVAKYAWVPEPTPPK